MGLKNLDGLEPGGLRNLSSLQDALFDVAITNTNSPINPGDTFVVDYSVDNTGGVSDTQEIRLEIDSVQEDSDAGVFLVSGDTTTGTLEWVTAADETAQDYTATVLSADDSTSQTVTVESGSAIPDSVVDNFESADADPLGPYETGDTLATYYDITDGDFERSSASPLLDDFSVERVTDNSQDSDAIVSAPGDGLPNYPSEGETLSLFVNVSDSAVVPTLLGGVPDSKGANGYGLLLVDADDVRLSKFVNASRADLDTATPTFGSSDFLELVVKPPASGESTVEAAVWQVDNSFNRSSQALTLSATDDEFTGNTGVGIMAQSFKGTGRVGDQLTRGRGIN